MGCREKALFVFLCLGSARFVGGQKGLARFRSGVENNNNQSPEFDKTRTLTTYIVHQRTA